MTKDEEAFDLTPLDVRPRAQEGVEMRVLDPAGMPTKAILRVRGTDSRAYTETIEAQVRRVNERGQQKQTEQERTEEFWELQGTLVCGWRPKLVIAKGEAPAEYSPGTAVRLLREHAYIWEQVRAFARARENFLPPPASSSSSS